MSPRSRRASGHENPVLYTDEEGAEPAFTSSSYIFSFFLSSLDEKNVKAESK